MRFRIFATSYFREVAEIAKKHAKIRVLHLQCRMRMNVKKQKLQECVRLDGEM